LLKRLDRDQGGNVIVLYIAAALLLIGMIWAIIGTGARMVQKETIQSSADAAAFSAAVIKAKGLNIIAFCNLVMAVLLAIIMLLRLIKGALTALVIACTVSCALAWTGAGGALCPFLGTAEQLRERYAQLEEQLEPRILDAMKGLAKLERVVNKTFPALSLVEGYRVGTNGAYKKNMSNGGTLVTVTWPLPIPGTADFSLPTKDGTWDELCNQAIDVFGRVLDAAMTKMGLGFAAGAFSGFVKMLLSPLKGILCDDNGGGGATINQDTNETDCSKCNGASSTILNGQKRVPAPGGNPGQFNWLPGQNCKEDYFDSSWCGGKVQWLSDCNGGEQFQWLTFQSCIVKEPQPVDLGGGLTGDKPLPLDLSDDWQQHSQVRAFTLLTSAAVAQRRQSVNVAVKAGQQGSAPALEELLGTAQAEFFAFNGHEDLWHMNWRARLVRFSFPTSLSGGDTSAASGGPGAGDSSTIASKVMGFMQNDVGAVLGDQFLLH
jgi:hypothetical protein